MNYPLPDRSRMDSMDPRNPANYEYVDVVERCDWPGCPNEAPRAGALCLSCQAEADAAAPNEDTL